MKQHSFIISNPYLAKNYFFNPASNKQLNTIFVLFGTNSPWDESSVGRIVRGTNRPGTKRPSKCNRSLLCHLMTYYTLYSCALPVSGDSVTTEPVKHVFRMNSLRPPQQHSIVVCQIVTSD